MFYTKGISILESSKMVSENILFFYFVLESFHVKHSNLVEVHVQTGPDLPTLAMHEVSWRRWTKDDVEKGLCIR